MLEFLLFVGKSLDKESDLLIFDTCSSHMSPYVILETYTVERFCTCLFFTKFNED